MNTVYIDCELAGPIGQRRIVTRTYDGLCDLRNACREALNATPKEEWCEGKTADEIVTELVRICLNPKQPLTADVFQYDMNHGNISVVLRMPRATALQITKEKIETMVEAQKPQWTCKV